MTKSHSVPSDGKTRVIIENVSPEIDQGAYPAKRAVGELFEVTCDLFTDGHDVVNGVLLIRSRVQNKWTEIPLVSEINDQWKAAYTVIEQGAYQYTIKGWVDYALTWQHELDRKVSAGVEVPIELLDGVKHLDRILEMCTTNEKSLVNRWIKQFKAEKNYEQAVKSALSSELKNLFLKYPTDDLALIYPKNLELYVDRKKAAFSAWYEFFPRSASKETGKHGTFKDCAKIVPRIADMGFDTIYFPPIHPIGKSHRKGKNNAVVAGPEDPGSPWAIGSDQGGHKSVHSELGDLEDFQHLIQIADDYNIEIAMDLAFQCSPDHPYVKEHPQWFKWRPDGSVQYAENPPKKYQDILPIYFENDDWQNLWKELLSVALYWNGQGIKIFRVDNPHTKPYRFWKWLIAEVKKVDPDVLFLAEAFTRPKIMNQLAKLGFSQSYTYYTWRNTKGELIEYMTELTQSGMKDFYRPNFWPNTPDINPYNLQSGFEALFLTRFFMAATLSANYGLYGPVYEFMVHDAFPGKEEYLNSEKYETKLWDWDKVSKLKELIKIINRIRKENPALQATNNIDICAIENDSILAYLKSSEITTNHLLMVVNLDPHNKQSGWVQLPLEKLGIKEGDPVTILDLITGVGFVWNKEWNYVELDPFGLPFHLFKIER